MKKVLVMLLFIFLICGCTKVSDTDINILIDNAINSNSIHQNTNRVGYSFNKPYGATLMDSSSYNETFRIDDIFYYLYVDIVSYYNKVNANYEENDISYYSRKISNKNKFGYIEINEVDDNKYLIEIMYNYAKIEVMVRENEIKNAVTYAISILSSINYKDKVIENIMGNDVLNVYEENVDIFKTVGQDNNSLKYIDDNSIYDKDVIPDMDLVN